MEPLKQLLVVLCLYRNSFVILIFSNVSSLPNLFPPSVRCCFLPSLSSSLVSSQVVGVLGVTFLAPPWIHLLLSIPLVPSLLLSSNKVVSVHEAQITSEDGQQSEERCLVPNTSWVRLLWYF